MKVIVAVKIAASSEEGARVNAGQVDPGSIDYDVNEWDRFAVEAALELRDGAGGEVIAISVGGEEVEDGLLDVLAMGVDRAIHVAMDDERTQLDAIATAKLLAAAIGSEAPDLILTGAQTSDGMSAATGTALAALLGLPRVAVVRSIGYDDGELLVGRELEGGLIERLRLAAPALLTVQTGINEPRYATVRGIRQAAAKPCDRKRPADYGLAEEDLVADSAAQVALVPQSMREGTIIEGDISAVAAQIAQIIKSRVAA